jgi:ribosomal protein S8
MNILIINFLITIKNATSFKKEFLKISYNQNFLPFVYFFYKEGLIQSFKIDKKVNKISIIFRYSNNNDNFNKLKLFSKPSRIFYFCNKEIAMFSNKQKIYFFSTDKGFHSNQNCKKLHLGGKLYFSI